MELKCNETHLTIAIAANHPGLVLPPPPCHSVARVIENQIKGLMELGHRVILLGPEDCNIDCEIIPVCRTAIPLEDDPGLVATNQVIRRMKETAAGLKGRVDIINGHGLDIPGSLKTTGMLEGCPVPNVTTCHSCIELENLNYFIGLKNPVISLSYNQRRACPAMNYAGNVYNGLEPDEFPVVMQPDDYVCFLGRMSARKQPHMAIWLARCLGLPIKLAGPVDPLFDLDYFKTVCMPLLNEPGVEYLGELGMKDKIRLLSHARMNLHPTGFRDPCPLVPIESGFCGTPTLAIARGALPELIKEGVNGYLAEDFAEGVFISQQCMELDRGSVAAYVRERFSRKRMAGDYVEIYRQILGID